MAEAWKEMKRRLSIAELAAMGGNVQARYNLGNSELRAGNLDRAIKHWLIVAGGGYTASVRNIRSSYSNGYAAKDVFEKLGVARGTKLLQTVTNTNITNLLPSSRIETCRGVIKEDI
jgi:hypothetical protein